MVCGKRYAVSGMRFEIKKQVVLNDKIPFQIS
jgi:hypothetical protein